MEVEEGEAEAHQPVGVAVPAAGEHWQFVVERRRPREEGEEEEEAERVVCQPLRVLEAEAVLGVAVVRRREVAEAGRE